MWLVMVPALVLAVLARRASPMWLRDVPRLFRYVATIAFITAWFAGIGVAAFDTRVIDRPTEPERNIGRMVPFPTKGKVHYITAWEAAARERLQIFEMAGLVLAACAFLGGKAITVLVRRRNA
jgi:hypothetical protein